MAQVVKIIPKNSMEEIRVELINYRGHDLVGMRVYSDFTKSKEMLPTFRWFGLRGFLAPALEWEVGPLEISGIQLYRIPVFGGAYRWKQHAFGAVMP